MPIFLRPPTSLLFLVFLTSTSEACTFKMARVPGGKNSIEFIEAIATDESAKWDEMFKEELNGGHVLRSLRLILEDVGSVRWGWSERRLLDLFLRVHSVRGRFNRGKAVLVLRDLLLLLRGNGSRSSFEAVETTGSSPYPDLSGDEELSRAVNELIDAGVINCSYEVMFQPQMQLNLVQWVTMLLMLGRAIRSRTDR